jgi:dihydrofolate reductase
MRRLLVFENLSVDGYFTDANNDMSVLKNPVDDPEFDAFVAKNASGDGVMLFGRVTYEMMANFWPSPMAAQMLPEVAKGMNARPKIVFSRTLREATWNNTTIVSDDAVAYVRALKEQPGPDLVVLGSGTIVAQLAQARLIDAYQFVIVPVVAGSGVRLFEGVQEPLRLQLGTTRSFRNGNLFTSYEGAHDAADHPIPVV